MSAVAYPPRSGKKSGSPGPMNVGDRAVWPLVSPCRATVLGWTGRAAICTRSSRPPSNPARAAMTKRSAFGALPSGSRRCLHPAHSRSRPPEDPSPTTGKHLRGPALTASLRAGCVTAARQAGPAEANAARSQPQNDPQSCREAQQCLMNDRLRYTLMQRRVSPTWPVGYEAMAARDRRRSAPPRAAATAPRRHIPEYAATRASVSDSTA